MVSSSSTLMVRRSRNNDEDGQTNGSFGSGHREDEEHEYLSVQVAQPVREGDKVEVHRQQHEFDAHEQQDDVLPVEEDASHRDAEQDAGQEQEMFQAHRGQVQAHGRFSASILTIRRRCSLVTATCAETSWTLRPGRLRMVSAMAATMANSSTTPANWKA